MFLKTVFKWLCIAGLSLILYSYTSYRLGQYSNNAAGFLSLLLLVPAVVLALREYGKSGPAFFRFKGIALGTLLGLGAGMLQGGWYLLYITRLNPSIVYQTFDTPQMRSELRLEGLSPDQVEEAIHVMGSLIPPAIQSITMIATITLAAFLISLVAAVALNDRVASRRQEKHPLVQEQV